MITKKLMEDIILLQIEIAYANLYRAYETNSIKDMHDAYNVAYNIDIPRFKEDVLIETQKILTAKNIPPPYSKLPITQINDICFVKLNAEGCLRVLEKEHTNYRHFYWSHYDYAQQTLWPQGKLFQKEDVLYKNQEKELTVADMLAMTKYAIGVADAIDPSNEEYAKAQASITALQGIDAILNNRQNDKPVNRMLHLVTSFISSTVKASVKDKEVKRGVMIGALLVDLTIDFFCKK